VAGVFRFGRDAGRHIGRSGPQGEEQQYGLKACQHVYALTALGT
jgi:hypothetical protein